MSKLSNLWRTSKVTYNLFYCGYEARVEQEDGLYNGFLGPEHVVKNSTTLEYTKKMLESKIISLEAKFLDRIKAI